MKNELQRRAELLSSEAYNPKALIALVKKTLGIKKDSELVRLVGFNASVISKVRHKRKLLSAELLLAFHDLTGLSIREMKQIMGAPGPSPFAAHRNSGKSRRTSIRSRCEADAATEVEQH